jgi:hypothetical protein
MSWLLKDTQRPAAIDPKSARKKATLISLPFAALGLLALMMLMHDGVMGGLTRDKAIKLGSVVVVAAGFVALIFGIFAKKVSMAEQLKASLSEDPQKPWLKRAEWAVGRIKSSGIPDGRSYLIMGITLTVVGLVIAAFTVPMAIRGKHYSNLIGLLFPLIGIAFLISIVQKILASRRFGDCFFEMTQVPASPGGRLQGEIRTALPLNPAQKIGLQVSCIRSVVAGKAHHRRMEEKVLWKDEKVMKSSAESDSGGGKIPVQFELPPDQPTCSQRGNETVSWRLLVLIPESNFRATFDVPVFKVDPQPT